MDLREIGWDSVDWLDLAQDRDQWSALVNKIINLFFLLALQPPGALASAFQFHDHFTDE
jgi:hypothetical protein